MNRSEIFKAAHATRRATACTMSQALKQAWASARKPAAKTLDITLYAKAGKFAASVTVNGTASISGSFAAHGLTGKIAGMPRNDSRGLFGYAIPVALSNGQTAVVSISKADFEAITAAAASFTTVPADVAAAKAQAASTGKETVVRKQGGYLDKKSGSWVNVYLVARPDGSLAERKSYAH